MEGVHAEGRKKGRKGRGRERERGRREGGGQKPFAHSEPAVSGAFKCKHCGQNEVFHLTTRVGGERVCERVCVAVTACV